MVPQIGEAPPGKDGAPQTTHVGEKQATVFAEEKAGDGWTVRLVDIRDRRLVSREYGDSDLFAIARDNDARLADSWFGKNPEMWPVLARYLAQRAPVTVWSAACSTGEEPYTLAMWLDHLAPSADVSIVASDIDADALELARDATYYPSVFAQYSSVIPAGVPLSEFMAVADAGRWTPEPARRIRRSGGLLPESFVEDYFDDGYELAESVRDRVTFLDPLDLLDDPWPHHDILMVRNVSLDVGLGALAKLIEDRRPSMVVVGNLEMHMGLAIDGYRWSKAPYPHFFFRSESQQGVS